MERSEPSEGHDRKANPGHGEALDAKKPNPHCNLHNAAIPSWLDAGQHTWRSPTDSQEPGNALMAADTTLHVQQCLDRLRAGDEAAHKRLLNIPRERLRRLT